MVLEMSEPVCDYVEHHSPDSVELIVLLVPVSLVNCSFILSCRR